MKLSCPYQRAWQRSINEDNHGFSGKRMLGIFEPQAIGKVITSTLNSKKKKKYASLSAFHAAFLLLLPFSRIYQFRYSSFVNTHAAIASFSSVIRSVLGGCFSFLSEIFVLIADCLAVSHKFPDVRQYSFYFAC